MVFIHASRSGFGRIPDDDGYGFNFSSNPKKVDEDEDDGFSLKKRKLLDRTVQVQGSSYTMRFMLGEFEYESAQIIGGQVYNGDGNDEKQVIARLGAALFDIRHPNLQRAGYVMAQGLHCVADAMTQEVYQACTALFTPSGEPKGAFQTLLRSKGQLRKLVYISGVFVDQAHMGKGLGLEVVRNLLRSLQDEGLWAGPGSVALLCPCGDPPKGTDELRDPQAPTPDNFQQLWSSAFNKLSTHFAKIGFAHCDSGKRSPAGPSDQKMYSFLEADALDGASASPGPPRVQAGDDNPRRTKRAKGPDSAPGGLKCRRTECQVRLRRFQSRSHEPSAAAGASDLGYECSKCGNGPWCKDCWSEMGEDCLFCGAAQCLRFYCADCQDFKFDTSGEMYCSKACAPPGTEFESFGTSDDDDDDDDDGDSEDEW